MDVASRLHEAGFVAYFAGGCVRDRLRGEEPKDYDVATDATPVVVKRLFPRAIGVGEAFGVMLVRRHPHTVEVATFRSDGTYSDSRRPDAVRFGDPQADAMRRDFTINGLFEDPRQGTIIDFVGGQVDLRSGLVRAIGDPMARMQEDRLRCLRAVRFAARFGFLIDPLTRHAVVATGDLRGVSRERIGHELRRMFLDPGRAEAAVELQRLGLDGAILMEQGMNVETPHLRGLPAQAAFETALVAWLLDRTATAATVPPEDELATLRRWDRALVLANDEMSLACAILGHVRELRRGGDDGAGAWTSRPMAWQRRRAAARGFREALALAGVLHPGRAGRVQEAVARLEARFGELAPPRLLGGDDLIRELRLSPGPNFKVLLDEIYDAQLEGRVSTREQALEMARGAASAAASPRSGT